MTASVATIQRAGTRAPWLCALRALARIAGLALRNLETWSVRLYESGIADEWRGRLL